MHSTNWDDLRFVLAVAELGSVSAAARNLGVNHATVLRRVSAFEESHRVSVFERTAQGYRLRPDSVPLIDAARDAAEAMGRVSSLLDGGIADGHDVVRVTSVDTLCVSILAPNLGALQKAASPGRVAVLTSNERLDMSRLQADIAVRPALALPEDLVGDQVAELNFGLYSVADAPDRWLGLGGMLAGSRPARWMRETLPRESVGPVSDSFLTLREMAAAGQGRAILPAVLGDADARLNRLPLPDGADVSVPLWVAVHRDLDDAPRLNPLRRALIRLLRQEAPALAGRVRS